MTKIHPKLNEGATMKTIKFRGFTLIELLVVIAIATALAFLQPIKYVNLIIVLILYHLARFVVDLILIAQGNTSWNILVPEMVYFLVVCGALIRFFPSKAEKVIGEEKPKEDVVSNIEDNSAGN